MWHTTRKLTDIAARNTTTHVSGFVQARCKLQLSRWSNFGTLNTDGRHSTMTKRVEEALVDFNTAGQV